MGVGLTPDKGGRGEPAERPGLAAFSTKWASNCSQLRGWPDEVGSDGVWPAAASKQNKMLIPFGLS